MADQVGAYHDNGTPAYYIEAGTGKPYRFLVVNGRETGQKVYLSPYAQPGVSLDEARASKPKGGGLLHGGSEWDAEKGEWRVPFDGGKLLNYAVGAGLGAGALNALGVLGGAGSASGGASMPALSTPASVLPAGTPGMIGAPAAAASTSAAAAPAASGGRTVAGALNKGLVGGLSGKQLGALGLIAAQFFGRPKSMVNSGVGQQSLASMQQMLDLQRAQAQRQDPLHKAVTQLAINLLPNSAFGAGPNRPEIS